MSLHVSFAVDTIPCWRLRSRPADQDLWGSWDTHRRNMACWYLFFSPVIYICVLTWSNVWTIVYIHLSIYLQGVSSLPDYVSFKIFPGTPLEHIFSAAGDDLLELLQGLFTFNPLTRTTATQVIQSTNASTSKLCIYPNPNSAFLRLLDQN